jgi:hypothetical protein
VSMLSLCFASSSSTFSRMLPSKWW